MSRYSDDYEDDDVETSRYSDDDSAESTTEDAEDSGLTKSARKIVRGGWSNADRTLQADSPYAQRLKIDADPVLVKFLEDEPYANYRQHWVERSGQKSFTCIKDMHAKGCPLCAAGNRPSARFAFNVVELAEDGEHTVRSYEVGPRDIDALKNLHNNPKQGPLTKHYWAISRTGKGATSQRMHQMVRERDLDEEWEIEPLTDAQLDDFMKQKYDSGIVPIPSFKTLSEIASEDLLADDDD